MTKLIPTFLNRAIVCCAEQTDLETFTNCSVKGSKETLSSFLNAVS